MNLNEERINALNLLQSIKPDWEVGGVESPTSIFATALAMVKPSIEDVGAQRLNNASISTMDDEYLVRTGAGKGIYRQPATTTKINFNVVSDRQTTIDADFRVQMSNGTILKPLFDNNAIVVGDNKVPFECLDTGVIDIFDSEIQILTPISGIIKVEYIETPYYIGTNIESIESLRIRAEKAITQLNTLEGKITNLLLTEANCNRALVLYRNRVNEYQGSFIEVGTYAVICYGGDSDKIKELLANNFTNSNFSVRTAPYGITDIITIDIATINGINTVGSQIPVGYSLASLEDYYLKIVFEDKTQVQESVLKSLILDLIEAKRLEDLGKNISTISFYNTINEYLVNNNIQTIITSIGLSKDNIDYYDTITPTELYNLLRLSENNIIIE